MDNPTQGEATECTCPFVDQCGFVHDNETKFPELVARIQKNYCTKPNCSQCARFRIYQTLGSGGVPPLMLPDQTNWARQIIEDCDQ